MEEHTVWHFFKYCLGIVVGVLPLAAIYGCFMNESATEVSMKQVTVDVKRPSKEIEDEIICSIYVILHMKERREKVINSSELCNNVRIVMPDSYQRKLESLLSDSGSIHFIGKKFDVEVAKSEIRELMVGIILHILKYDSSVAIPLIRSNKRFLSKARKASDCVIVLETNKDIKLPDGYIMKSAKGDSAFVNIIIIGKPDGIDLAIKNINEKYYKFKRKLFFSLRQSLPTMRKSVISDVQSITNEYFEKIFDPREKQKEVKKLDAEEESLLFQMDEKDETNQKQEKCEQEEEELDLEDKTYLDLLNELLEEEENAKSACSQEDVHNLNRNMDIKISDFNESDQQNDADLVFGQHLRFYNKRTIDTNTTDDPETCAKNDDVSNDDNYENRKSYIELLQEIMADESSGVLDTDKDEKVEDDDDDVLIKPKKISRTLKYEDGLLGELQRELDERNKRFGGRHSIDLNNPILFKGGSCSTSESMSLTSELVGSQTLDYKVRRRHTMKNVQSSASKRRMFSKNKY